MAKAFAFVAEGPEGAVEEIDAADYPIIRRIIGNPGQFGHGFAQDLDDRPGQGGADQSDRFRAIGRIRGSHRIHASCPPEHVRPKG